jgi:hypothetical protein
MRGAPVDLVVVPGDHFALFTETASVNAALAGWLATPFEARATESGRPVACDYLSTVGTEAELLAMLSALPLDVWLLAPADRVPSLRAGLDAKVHVVALRDGAFEPQAPLDVVAGGVAAVEGRCVVVARGGEGGWSWVVTPGRLPDQVAREAPRPALSPPPPAPRPPGPPLGAAAEARCRRADRVALTGQVLTIVGPALAVGGVTAMAMASGRADPATSPDQDGLSDAGLGVAVAGSVVALAGPPLLAGGTMRMHHVLAAGGTTVSPALGWTTWGLYGGELLLIGVAVGTGEAGPGAEAGALVYLVDALVGAGFRAKLQGAHDATRPAATLTLVPGLDGLTFVGCW